LTLAGVATALDILGDEFYAGLADAYRRRRDLLHAALVASGFRCTRPEGAYYILADYAALAPLAGDPPTIPPSRSGSREIGVTPVPGSSFFREGECGRSLVRFVFCKTDDVLSEAARGSRLWPAGWEGSGGRSGRAARSGLQR
jgi:aspartate/methionine/tyrosine aminotransferase